MSLSYRCGKKTPKVDWYRSGFTNQAKWGPENGGLAVFNIANNTAVHLETIQRHNENDQKLSELKIMSRGKHLISLLLDDANLIYVFKGESSANKGNPQSYTGKIPIKDIDSDYFILVSRMKRQSHMLLKYTPGLSSGTLCWSA